MKDLGWIQCFRLYNSSCVIIKIFRKNLIIDNFHIKENIIYDKEPFVIICVFEEWYLKLAETFIKNPIYMIINHKNLEYFMTSKENKLNKQNF